MDERKYDLEVSVNQWDDVEVFGLSGIRELRVGFKVTGNHNDVKHGLRCLGLIFRLTWRHLNAKSLRENPTSNPSSPKP